jgi:CheY-like chemotaxis protein
MKTANRNILVVDDMSNWRTTVETLLKSYGYTVTVASNAFEAFRAINQASYAAAILDVRLDDMDDSNHEGVSTVLTGIHRECPLMGFVVISSYYNEAEVRGIVPEGVSVMYVDKNNFRIDELMAALEQLCEG